MNICYLADAKSSHTQKWVRHFADLGYEIHLVSPRYADIKGVQIHLIDFYPSYKNHLALYWNLLIGAFKLRRLLKEIRPDIIHVHSLFWESCLGLIFLRKIPNLVVSTWGRDIICYEEDRESRKESYVKRVILKRADKITATSHFLAKATAAYAPTGKHVEVIPFGVHTNAFCPSNENRKKSNQFTLGFVKHLKPTYGPDYLLRAMPKVLERFPNTRLLLIGSGELEGELKELASQLKITEHVQFVGAVPHKEVPAYLKQMDVFVMPSILETLGVSALEAQAMEVPVVSSRVGGVPEAVIDGETGILVPPRDTEAIAAAIIKLLESEELRKRMGEKGREFVVKNYEWEKCAEKMEEIYLSLVNESTV